MEVEATIKTRQRFIEIRKKLEEAINASSDDVRERTPLTKAWELVNDGVADFYEREPSPFMYAGMNFIVDSDVPKGVVQIITNEPLKPITMQALAANASKLLQEQNIPLANRMAFCVHCNATHKITDSNGVNIPLPKDCKWRLDYKNATGKDY